MNDRKSHVVRTKLNLLPLAEYYFVVVFLHYRFRFSHSLGLQKNCKTFEEWDEEYRTMIPLADVPGVQPENYLVRFPFYILAERDANIVFSETQEPDWLVDNVYEICEYKRIKICENKDSELHRNQTGRHLNTDQSIVCKFCIACSIRRVGE